MVAPTAGTEGRSRSTEQPKYQRFIASNSSMGIRHSDLGDAGWPGIWGSCIEDLSDLVRGK